uniref:Uncharacterized protein n=1 Tax=Archangium disciforme TaxID=38 RepID=A0A3Q8I1Y6_9BACT|nr:hypothetical protein [Archangium disciforme]
MPSRRLTFYENRLNPRRDGYFPSPTPANHPELLREAERRLWLRTEEIFELLKVGRFGQLQELLSIYHASTDGVLRATIGTLLGDAATFDCFQQMREDLERVQTAAKETRRQDELYDYRDMALDFCDAFSAWGLLDAVPVIVDHYLSLRINKVTDIRSFPVLLSTMLEQEVSIISTEPPEDGLDEYLGLILHRHETLRSQYGGGDVLLFQGMQAGVKNYANILAHGMETAGHLKLELRRRFEASTGIDCHDMYSNGVFQPLAAARIAESFLNSPEAAKYQDGARYFFGHRIPD